MRRRGFTLLECLIATVVVGAGIAVALAGISASLRAEVHSQNASRAARLLDEMLGRIEGGEIQVEAASGDFTAQGAPDVTWTIVVNATDQPNLNEMVLTAQWTEHGDPVDASVTRWFFQPPPVDSSGTPTTGSGG
jgi:prepilin-type N-terminal cleavage/methylation domain-containing protein